MCRHSKKTIGRRHVCVGRHGWCGKVHFTYYAALHCCERSKTWAPDRRPHHAACSERVRSALPRDVVSLIGRPSLLREDSERGFDARLRDVLRRLRLENGMDQHELADAIGRTRASIANIEAGRQGITLTVLYRIARVYGVPPSRIIEEAEHP